LSQASIMAFTSQASLLPLSMGVPGMAQVWLNGRASLLMDLDGVKDITTSDHVTWPEA
jgi:hypothetical protein